jgi:hypothetical protein
VLHASTQGPIFVKIVETPEPGLGQIMMSALGLTGVLVLGAVLVGILVAGVIFWVRSRSEMTRSDVTRPTDPS